MKTNPRMNDAERKEAWLKVEKIEEACEEMLAHQDWAASSDPYYADMTGALWAMFARCFADRKICNGCGADIDPDTCGCGDPMTSHTLGSGHNPIPLGCNCYRVKAEFEPTKPFGGDGSVPF